MKARKREGTKEKVNNLSFRGRYCDSRNPESYLEAAGHASTKVREVKIGSESIPSRVKRENRGDASTGGHKADAQRKGAIDVVETATNYVSMDAPRACNLPIKKREKGKKESARVRQKKKICGAAKQKEGEPDSRDD